MRGIVLNNYLRSVFDKIIVQNSGFSSCRGFVTSQHPESGGFTGAVDAEQAEALARRNSEADALNCGERATKLLRQLVHSKNNAIIYRANQNISVENINYYTFTHTVRLGNYINTKVKYLFSR